MTYALVTADHVDAIGNLPTGARRLDTGAWVTPPAGGWTPDLAAACGWHEVTETPRPADTATHTHDRTLTLAGGVPTVTWVQREWTAGEVAARQAAADDAVRVAVDRAILDAIRHASESAHTDGEGWVRPVGAHDAYPAGITVTHDGKTWESLIPANVWAPGVSGWREVVAEGHPAWVQPTGAHDAYDAGAVVTHAGQTWTSTVGGNVWEPGVYGWTLTP